MKVVAFNGSPRENGNTAILLRCVLEELEKAGIETEFVQIGGRYIHGCIACEECRRNKDGRCAQTDDPVNDWIEKILAAQGVLLGSPTYFADVTPEMKAFIDRTGYVARANDRMFRHKVGAAVVAVRRAGAIHALDTLIHYFLINEMIVPGSSYWALAIGREKGEVEHDKEGLETMKTLGRNMAWLLGRLYGSRAA